MEFLKNTDCYIGGPIENSSCIQWREEPKKILTERFGVTVFDPFSDPKQQWVPTLQVAREGRDFDTMHRIAKQFVRKDLCIVDRTDFGIWNLPYKTPTTGSIHEIINCNNSKKAALLVCTEGKQYLPLWFFGFIPLEFMFDSWVELYEYLDKINIGETKNDRWDYVLGRL